MAFPSPWDIAIPAASCGWRLGAEGARVLGNVACAAHASSGCWQQRRFDWLLEQLDLRFGLLPGCLPRLRLRLPLGDKR
jgi:hypothetical protein